MTKKGKLETQMENTEIEKYISRLDVPETQNLIRSYILEKPQDEAERIIDALITHKSDISARILKSLLNEDTRKVLKKNIKKAIYKLKMAGVVIPEDEITPAVTARKKDLWKPFRALISLIDYKGNRIGWLASEGPNEANAMIGFFITESSGISECFVQERSRRGLLKEWEHLHESINVPSHEVPVDYFLSVIRNAYDRNQATGNPLPLIFEKWKKAFRDHLPPSGESFIYKELNVSEIESDPSLLRDFEKIIQTPEVSMWLGTFEILKDCIYELMEIRERRIIVSPWIKQEQEKEVLKKAIEFSLKGDKRELLKKRLEDISYHFLHTNREDYSRRALAAALALKESSGIELNEHPFVKSFITSVLEFGIQNEQKDKRIVSADYKPVEVMNQGEENGKSKIIIER